MAQVSVQLLIVAFRALNLGFIIPALCNRCRLFPPTEYFLRHAGDDLQLLSGVDL